MFAMDKYGKEWEITAQNTLQSLSFILVRDAIIPDGNWNRFRFEYGLIIFG
jgi:hypothetical protein